MDILNTNKEGGIVQKQLNEFKGDIECLNAMVDLLSTSLDFQVDSLIDHVYKLMSSVKESRKVHAEFVFLQKKIAESQEAINQELKKVGSVK